MAQKVLILLGTKKGAFILESDTERRSWDLRGPHCATWPMNHVIADPETGTIYAAGGNEWFGPAVWRSTDLGTSWTHSSRGLGYAPGEQPIKTVWSLASGHGRLYAGVEPAGLFCSTDGGQVWEQVSGLRDHPSRPEWQPGGGGLMLHSLVLHPEDETQIWVGISAGGVFHTADGGETWEARNRGTRADFLPEALCCMGRGSGRTGPYPVRGSGNADGLRASRVQHAVEGVNADVDLGHAAPVGARVQPVADHPLVPRDSRLGPGTCVVARRFLPAHPALLGDELQVAVP